MTHKAGDYVLKSKCSENISGKEKTIEPLDSFRPKYKHSNPSVRLSVVEQLTNERALIGIARSDDVTDVRRTALKRMNMQFPLKLLNLMIQMPGALRKKKFTAGILEKQKEKKAFED